MSSKQLYAKDSLSLPIDIDIPDDVQPYKDLVRGPRQDTDPIIMLGDLREGIASLPETVRTFPLKRVVDVDGNGGLYGTLIKFTPAWSVPEWQTGAMAHSGRTRYVNPHTSDARLFSDVPTKCECGALIHNSSIGNDNSDVAEAAPARTEHTDDCVQIWRWRTRASVWERRREIILDGVYHGLLGHQLVDRAGYSGRGLNDHPDRHDIDYQAEVTAAQRRKAWTAALLLHRHSPAEIARAFNVTGKRLADILHEEGVTEQIDLREMYRIRRGWDS